MVKDRYLVQTAGLPLIKGGSKSFNRTRQDAVTTAAKSAGATVTKAHNQLWTGLAVTATRTQIQKLAAAPDVVAVYPVLKVSLPKTEKSATKQASSLAEIAAAGTDYTGQGVKVGIIDTGVDYNHVDLGGSGTPGGDTFPTVRVAYGYDFVGDNYNGDDTTRAADADPDDCGGHGTHVAGIVGADGDDDNGGAVGVATDVTLGAYRVFGCEGSTSTDVIIEALARARTDGMDVVNLSLGSDFDSWPDYPDAVAVSNLAAAGVVVVVAAGNSGDTGLFSAGSPAVGAGVISVASYESEKIRIRAISVNGVKYAYTSVEDTAPAPADNASQLTLRVASNTTACNANPVLTAVPADTALLVKRGTCAFSEKVANAQAAGAEAVVLYNNVPSLDSFTATRDGQPPFTIPAIAIGGTDGANLASLIAASGAKAMTWLNYQQDVTNPDGGALSTFSSAGIAADLSLVPTITAPGGKIYSTLPIEQDEHGNLSGTSMATPFVAGSVALLLEARPALNPAGVSQLLYNSAVPVAKSTEAGVTTRPEAVFRQGSGLIKVANAIGASVVASPSILKLGEGTSHIVKVTLTNTSATTLTYKPSRVSGVSAAASTTGTYMGTTTPKYAFGEVGFKAYSKTVTLAPGGSAVVKLKLTAPSKALKGKAGMLYGGWVRFTTSGAGNTISVPFVGVRGDYQKVKLLNKFKLVDDEGKNWSLPRLGVEVNEGGADDGIYFLPSTKSNQYQFDLDIFSPSVIYHLDYPASDVRLKVINTRTHKKYYAIIDWGAANAVAGNPLRPRSPATPPLRSSPSTVLYLNKSNGVSWPFRTATTNCS